MGVLEVSWRRLCGVVGVGVVEAHNLHSRFPRFTLNLHQLGGIDFETFGRIGANVSAGNDPVYMSVAGYDFPGERSAAFFGVVLLGMLPECFVIGDGNVQAQRK